jgi:hypothetical protein
MLFGEGRDHLAFHQHLDVQSVGVAKRRNHKADIGFVGLELCDLLRRHRFGQHQLDFRILLAKCAQDGGQDFAGRTRDERHPQRAAQSGTGAARRLHGALGLDHRALAFFKKHPARRGPRSAGW